MIDVDKIIQDSPRFWGYQRKSILQAIADFIKPKGKVTDVELDYIIKHQLRRNKNHRQVLKQVALLLTKLKDDYGIDTVIPPVPITVPRPSILPTTANEFAWLDGCHALEDTFWNLWSVKYFNQKDAPMFAFGFCLASYAGLQSTLISNILTQLKWSDILEDGKSTKSKIHPQDREDRYCHIHLPTPASLILKSIMHHGSSNNPNNHVFFGESEPKFKKRKQRIQKVLASHFALLLDVHSKQTGCNLPCPPTWKTFSRTAYMKIFSQGIEPFIINALHSYPLPVSHPIEASLKLYGKPLSHHLSISQTTLPQGNAQEAEIKLKSAPFTTSLEDAPIKDDWCGASKTILRQLVCRLKKITTKKFTLIFRFPKL